MTSSFNTSGQYPGSMFGANLVILAQIYDELSHGQANFLEFWVEMAKMTLKVTVNDPYFQYQVKVSHDECLMQIWWFRLKSVMSYCADKVKFTDGGTDWQTQATTIPLRLKGQGLLKMYQSTPPSALCFDLIEKRCHYLTHWSLGDLKEI